VNSIEVPRVQDSHNYGRLLASGLPYDLASSLWELLVVIRTPTTTVGFLQVAYPMILQVRCCQFKIARAISKGVSKATKTIMENVDVKLV
jgi:hypothetical protein